MEKTNSYCPVIENISSRMKKIYGKGELGLFLAEEVLKYNAYELQVIFSRSRGEIERLPENYRDKLRPYAREWLSGRYHRLILLYRKGLFRDNNEPVKCRDTYLKYCDIIPKACFDNKIYDCRSEDDEKNPYYNLFYYLVCAFAMFVEDEPGHPVGTPFPGGFEVVKEHDGYLCPIRDKEEEILYSVCNFCPAKQDKRNI
ncbi:hypothetical protein J2128_002436 [Methanomicrobium sp. W14]|jgi:hypothetical protein|uniref:DUF2115 domain-containing protein n=1 Tax=Methanomicrobium sp. W14 TaxID=2817839 RepID=UPI001AEAF30A|nr:DUF2115 domain-containing protein [Methanomicrobium sp. W14]MBP2134470.1 hypothetical protein [Methanomicrobium sp. W14]